MLRVIYGNKGSGKTKQLLDLANSVQGTSKGSVVFIDSDKDCMFGLSHCIRFVDASEFHIDGPKMFAGFIAGIAALVVSVAGMIMQVIIGYGASEVTVICGIVCPAVFVVFSLMGTIAAAKKRKKKAAK